MQDQISIDHVHQNLAFKITAEAERVTLNGPPGRIDLAISNSGQSTVFDFNFTIVTSAFASTD